MQVFRKNMEKTFYFQHTVPARQFQRYPLNWDDIFSRNAPLAVEIGFGNGAFLMDWSIKMPAWNFVGIELSGASLEKLQKRILNSGVSNVAPLHEDARFALREFFPADSLMHVMMNFPDPWPKDRHRRRRLLDEDFVKILAMVLKKSHSYELVTDQQWYAVHAFNLFGKSACFEVLPIEKNPSRPVTTKYEQKWQEMGRDSFRVRAVKIKSARVNRLLEDAQMPHAFVEKEITSKIIENLIGFTHKEVDKLFVVKEYFRDADEKRFLLRIVAKDGGYQQDFYLRIVRQNKNRWLVKLDPTIQPYRTPAVKMAVWRIGRCLNAENEPLKSR